MSRRSVGVVLPSVALIGVPSKRSGFATAWTASSRLAPRRGGWCPDVPSGWCSLRSRSLEFRRSEAASPPLGRHRLGWRLVDGGGVPTFRRGGAPFGRAHWSSVEAKRLRRRLDGIVSAGALSMGVVSRRSSCPDVPSGWCSLRSRSLEFRRSEAASPPLGRHRLGWRLADAGSCRDVSWGQRAVSCGRSLRRVAAMPRAAVNNAANAPTLMLAWAPQRSATQPTSGAPNGVVPANTRP